jgi:hypothetical protein
VVAGAGSDIDGDGLPDRVSVSLTGSSVKGSDIPLQASLTRLGPDSVTVHGYAGQGTPSVVGVFDAFQTGSAAIFVGTGRNDSLGTAVATLVVLNGTELKQVQPATADPSAPYVTLNYSFNLDTPSDTGSGTTTTAGGPTAFSTNAAATTRMAYGCTGGELYEDLATQNSDGSWMMSRQWYQLKGATLLTAGSPQPSNAMDAEAARKMLAADRCGSVNEAGPGPTG